MSNTSGGSFVDSSLVSKATQSSFDVRIERDVINLLYLVHVQSVDPQIKNHLRDLIFTYRQTLAPEDGMQVQQSFAALGVTVVYTDIAPHKKQTAQAPRSFGATRPAPTFSPVVVSNTPRPSAPVHLQEVVTTEQSSHTEHTVTPQAPEQVTEESPHEAPAVAPVVAESMPLQSQADASLRIKEIKRSVNEKVGNPVNLIDTHEAIGREYMTALLDAMKKVNGASAGDLASAMVRLESAFAAVQASITESAAATPAASAPATSVESSVPHESTPVAVETTPEAPAPETVRAPLTASGGVTPVAPTRMSSVHQHLVEKAVIAESETVAPVSEVVAMPSQSFTEVTPAAPVQQEVTQESSLHSVAKEKQLQELLQSKLVKDAQSKQQQEDARIAQMDPLQTPEVTAGLNQLLSEWSLFRSSGLFGTGPNGSDHALYKKLSTLTMAAVIAGRFEGATPAIKQSITDYMNGWRYEEGIVHEHMETFEHYLRKVVRHILNRKKIK